MSLKPLAFGDWQMLPTKTNRGAVAHPAKWGFHREKEFERKYYVIIKL